MLILTHVWLVRQETLVVDQRPIGFRTGPQLLVLRIGKVARPPFILLALVLPCVVRGLDPRGRASFRASLGVTVSVSARLFVYVVANPYFLPAQFKKYGG